MQNNTIKIKSVEVPTKGTATQLFLRAVADISENATCATYYELQDENGVCLLSGNKYLNAQEYADNKDNLQDYVLSELGLTK
jgi:hypothetical protein